MKGEAPRLELPEGDRKDPVKARIAVFAAAVALVGTVAALLQSTASTNESRATREAQRKAIEAFGLEVRADVGRDTDYGAHVERERYGLRQRLAAGRALAAEGDASVRLADEAARWERAKASIAAPVAKGTTETPDEFTTRFDETELYSEAKSNPFRRGMVATLQQESQSDLADDWSDQSDALVVVLTLVAAALFLLGLAASVEQARTLLLVPGVALALFCLGRVFLLGTHPPAGVPQEAIEAVVDADLLVAKRAFGPALAKYTKAIEIHPTYGSAYLKRADVYFRRGSPQQGAQYVSIVDPDDLPLHIADLDRASELGAGADEFLTLASLGFAYFLDGRYEEAEEATAEALKLNDQIAAVHFNLGVARLARGREAEALEAYERGVRVLNPLPVGEQAGAYSGARTDLELLSRAEPRIDGLPAMVKRTHEWLTRAEFAGGFECAPEDRKESGECLNPHAEYRALDKEAPEGASFSSPQLTRLRGEKVLFEYHYENVPKGTRLTDHWYRRVGPSEPWAHVPYMTHLGEEWSLEESGDASVESAVDDCPIPGEYRLDRFLEGERVLQSVPIRVGEGPLGPLRPYNYPDLGFYACRPPDWKVEPLGVGGVELRSPAGDVSFSIGTFPVAPAAGGSKEAVELRQIRKDPVGQLADTPGSIDLRVGRELLPARMACFDQQVGNSPVRTCRIAVLAPDSILRAVAVRAPRERLADHDELLATLVFTVRRGA